MTAGVLPDSVLSQLAQAASRVHEYYAALLPGVRELVLGNHVEVSASLFFRIRVVLCCCRQISPSPVYLNVYRKRWDSLSVL